MKDEALIKKRALEIRKLIVEAAYRTGEGRKAHPGPALSAADIVSTLYFGVMKYDPCDPKMPDRDRFILSKGHACLVLYSALCLMGLIPKEDLMNFRDVECPLQGHPDMKHTPGVDMTAGSLGHGLSAGLGMALAAKINHRDYRVYVLLGDGEIQEGLIWEAAMYSGSKRVSNLTAVVDVNGWQSCGRVDDINSHKPLADKWRSFGWNVITVDGHDVSRLLDAFQQAKACTAGPTVILAQTVKGKGVSFMENDNSWHQRALSEAEYKTALSDLAGGDEE